MSERLDRIEALLEGLTRSQATTQAIVDSNARAIEANSNAIAELRQVQEVDRLDFRASVEDMVENIMALAQQAEQDRVEFRGTVQRILDALTQRFSGNGHS